MKAYFSKAGFGNIWLFSHSSRHIYHAILDIQSTRGLKQFRYKKS